jgi:hypothetical protein
VHLGHAQGPFRPVVGEGHGRVGQEPQAGPGSPSRRPNQEYLNSYYCLSANLSYSVRIYWLIKFSIWGASQPYRSSPIGF